MSSDKPKKQTVGFKYKLTMHLGLCHGQVDAIHSIWFADKIAWSGDVYATGGVQRFNVSQEDLFGGTDTGGEGGVSGVVEVAFGSDDQTLLGVKDDGTWDVPALSTMGFKPVEIPTYACNYRGLCVVNLYDWYWGTNPYLKAVSIEASRYPAGWLPAGSELARIGVDCNPACMIWEASEDTEWGMGYDRSWLNQESFQTSAQTLKNEGFGMSMSMQTQETVEEFINRVCEHVDGSFYFRPSLSQWVFNLVRPGDPVRLELDPDNCKLKSFKRRLLGETVNQITVRYTNPELEDFASVGVQDDANIQAQGQPVPGTVEYPGIRNETLALIAAQRDLKTRSACLATAEVSANRKAWDLIPGDTILFTWPRLKVAGLRMRVTAVTHGESGSADISVSLIEDVFGQVDDPFSGLSAPRGTKDLDPPGPYDRTLQFEVPFWFVREARNLDGQNIPDILLTWNTFMVDSANNDFRLARLFHKDTLPSGYQFNQMSTGKLVSLGTLQRTMLREHTFNTAFMLGMQLTIDPDKDFPLIDRGFSREEQVYQDSFAVMDDGKRQEIVRVINTMNPEYDPTLQLSPAFYMYVERGLMDTHVHEWPVGTPVYFINDLGTLEDPPARDAQSEHTYRIAMQGSRSTTPIDEVADTTVFLRGRQGRPLPAQNIAINGVYWPTSTEKDETFTVTWNTRNRLLQVAEQQVMWGTPTNIEPEAGTVFIVELWGRGDSLAPYTLADRYEGGWVEGGVTVEFPSASGPLIDLDLNNSSGSTGADYGVIFNEGQALGVKIADTDLAIGDLDSTNLTGGTVVLTNARNGDTLDAGDMVPGITTAIDAYDGKVVLTLTGDAPISDYQIALSRITYRNVAVSPSITPRSIQTVLTDGVAFSNTATTRVVVVRADGSTIGLTPSTTPNMPIASGRYPKYIKLVVRSERTTDGITLDNYQDFVWEWQSTAPGDPGDGEQPDPGEYKYVHEASSAYNVDTRTGFMDSGAWWGFFRPGGGATYGSTINLGSEGSITLPSEPPVLQTAGELRYRDNFYWPNPNGSYDGKWVYDYTQEEYPTWEAPRNADSPNGGRQMLGDFPLLGILREGGEGEGNGNGGGYVIVEGDATGEREFWYIYTSGGSQNMGSEEIGASGSPPNGRPHAWRQDGLQDYVPGGNYFTYGTKSHIKGQYIAEMNVTVFTVDRNPSRGDIVADPKWADNTVTSRYILYPENWPLKIVGNDIGGYVQPYPKLEPSMVADSQKYTLVWTEQPYYLYRAPGETEFDPRKIYYPEYPWTGSPP